MVDPTVIAVIVQFGVAGVLLWRLNVCDKRLGELNAEIVRLNNILIDRQSEFDTPVVLKPKE